MKIFRLFAFAVIIIYVTPSYGNTLNFQSASNEDSLKIIEKVYLHIDRETYYAGDDIWFKAYLVEATDRLLTDHSTNLHVELISPIGEITDSRVVRITGGLGNGDFHLAEKLKSGRYIIRAYTNYMRNFGEDQFFKKEMKIINPSDAGIDFADTLISVTDRPDISFFPEGGSLVETVTSVVAFKAVDDHGLAVEVSGEIYSSAGNKVTDFKSTHNGMGAFSIKPVPGLNYFAVTKNKNGDLLKYEIPDSFSKGIVIGISKNQSRKLSLTIRTNSETLPLVLDRDLSLTVSARNKPLVSYSIRMKSLNSLFNLPTADLPEGIVKLTLSGPDGIPLCERLVFLQKEDDVKIKVKTDKSEYRQRDSVSVKISLSVNSRIAQDAFLSLTATDNFFADNSSAFPSTISSWFLLESDVRGPVEEPSYYFDPSNPTRLKDLDLLLLTQGWRDFEWKYKEIKFPPEHGFAISGRVRKKFADVPLMNSTVNLAIFDGGQPSVNFLSTDSTGRFHVKGVDMTGEANLIASVTGDNDKLQGWILLDSVKYTPAIVKEQIVQTKYIQNNDQFTGESQMLTNNLVSNKNLRTYIQYAEIRTSIRKQYKLSDTITPGEVTITAKSQDSHEAARVLSERSLRTINIDKEYVVTPESKIYANTAMILEYNFHIKSASTTNPLISLTARDTSGSPGSIFVGGEGPIYLLNGMEVGFDGISFLPVEWVERIDYLKPRNAELIWGIRGRGGVVSVILKTGASTEIIRPLYHSVNTKFSGFNEPRRFYSPKHHTTLLADYKPDLRTTLFWEPDIKVENNKDIILNYYNADNSASVRVIVEGITSSGIPVSGAAEYVVR